MQTTFVLTILLGAPIVALASIPATLPTWEARASFAIRVGAIVWLVVAIGAFLYARRETGENQSGPDSDLDSEDDRDDAGNVGDTEQDGNRDGESAASPEPHSPPSERSSET
ncbi:peptidoglycan-binding protein [Halobacteriales archaeon QS_3_64_16]|nr:MAG: peptidoglycan-binding protein [Halobacteriales archaeon QS_3_64_16]